MKLQDALGAHLAVRLERMEPDVGRSLREVPYRPLDMFQGIDAYRSLLPVPAERGVEFLLELDDLTDALVVESQPTHHRARGEGPHLLDARLHQHAVAGLPGSIGA